MSTLQIPRESAILSKRERELLVKAVLDKANKEALNLIGPELKKLHDKLQSYYQVILDTPGSDQIPEPYRHRDDFLK